MNKANPRDAANIIAEDISKQFGWTRANSAALAHYVFDRILERVMVNGEMLAFYEFGTFDRRFVDHKKRVWNQRDGGGGETAPQYVLRFKPSRKAHVELLPVFVGPEPEGTIE